MLTREDFSDVSFEPQYVQSSKWSRRRVNRLDVFDNARVGQRWLPPLVRSGYSFYDIYHPSFAWRAPDPAGTIIRVHVLAPPPHTPVRGCVLYLHGMNDHGLRMTFIHERLLSCGLAVVAPDQPACGTSDGPAGCRVNDLREWVITAMLAHRVRCRRWPGVPFILMGHSLGGLTAFITAHVFPETCPAGLVLYSPALEVERRSAPPGSARLVDMLPCAVTERVLFPTIPREPLMTADPANRCLAPFGGPLSNPICSLQTAVTALRGSMMASRLIAQAYHARYDQPCADNRTACCRRLRPAREDDASGGVCACFTSGFARRLERTQGYQPAHLWSMAACLPPPLVRPLSVGPEAAAEEEASPSPADILGLPTRVAMIVGSNDPLCEWRRAWQLALALGGPDWVRPETSASSGGPLRLPVSDSPAASSADADRPFWCYYSARHEPLRDSAAHAALTGLVAWMMHGVMGAEAKPAQEGVQESLDEADSAAELLADFEAADVPFGV